MNATASLEQMFKRHGAVCAEFHADDKELPAEEELMKLASFSKKFTDFNLNYLLFGWGEPRKRKTSNFHLNPALLKNGTAGQWDEYLPNFLANARRILGVSQKELAEAMQRTGIYRGKGVVNFIYRMEQGATTFRFVDFISLVLAVRDLGYPVTFGEIFGEKAREETLDSNILTQRVDLLKKEIQAKDDLINHYKNLLDQK